MSHIGVERLGAGHRQHDRAEGEEGKRRVIHEKPDRVLRVDRGEHAGLACDAQRAQDRDHDKPQAHHGTEQRTDAAGAVTLDREQRDENGDRRRHDERVQSRCHDLEPFNRGQHRNRRRDHAVTVEHRRAEDAEPDQPPAPPRLPFQSPRDKRSQRQHAALAVVVGAQHQRHVFERYDDDERPEDHRQHAQHVNRGQRQRMRPVECFAQRIERTGADVAVDDADGADHQRGHPVLGGMGIAHVRRAAGCPRSAFRPCGARSGC